VHFQLPMELSVVFTNPQNLSDKTGPGFFGKNIGFTPRNVHPIMEVNKRSIYGVNSFTKRYLCRAFLFKFQFPLLRMK
jgi:hypothetical protein